MRDPDLRVSQAERDEVVNVLATHYADGRLALGEYEDRVASAVAATTGRDLDALFTDLPSGTPATATATTTTTTVATAARPWTPDAAPGGIRRHEPGRRRLPRAPLVLVVLAIGVLVTPWAFFLLIPVLGGGPHGGHLRHAHRHGPCWARDDRESVRML